MKTLTQIHGFQLLKIQDDLKTMGHKIGGQFEIRPIGKTRVNPGDFEETISESVNGTYYGVHCREFGGMLPYYVVKYTRKDGTEGRLYAI